MLTKIFTLKTHSQERRYKNFKKSEITKKKRKMKMTNVPVLFVILLSIHVAHNLASQSDVYNVHKIKDKEEVKGRPVEEDTIFFHHNFEQMVELMEEVHKACPEITRLYNLSEPSVEGRNLTVLEITENPGVHVPGKTVFVHF